MFKSKQKMDDVLLNLENDTFQIMEKLEFKRKRKLFFGVVPIFLEIW